MQGQQEQCDFVVDRRGRAEVVVVELSLHLMLREMSVHCDHRVRIGRRRIN